MENDYKINWPLYEALLYGQGESKRDTAINDALENFENGMIDSPDYQEDSRVEGENIPILASRKSALSCDFKALPGTEVYIGDIVDCFEEKWIVVEVYADAIGIVTGTMWLCNNILRFQNHSEAVNSRFCVVDSGNYPKRPDPDAFVMTNTYKVYVSIDKETEKLFVDKRLGFGQIYSSEGEPILEVYKIIGMDIKSKNLGKGSHLMVMSVQRDVFNSETDSLVENLCDIYKENSSSSEPQPTGSCKIIGRDEIRIGTSREYTVVFTDKKGVQDNTAEAVWTATLPDGIEFTSVSHTGKIKIPFEEKYIGETLTLKVKDTLDIYGTYIKEIGVIPVG